MSIGLDAIELRARKKRCEIRLANWHNTSATYGRGCVLANEWRESDCGDDKRDENRINKSARIFERLTATTTTTRV